MLLTHSVPSSPKQIQLLHEVPGLLVVGRIVPGLIQPVERGCTAPTRGCQCKVAEAISQHV